jgi:hypothetical protein
MLIRHSADGKSSLHSLVASLRISNTFHSLPPLGRIPNNLAAIKSPALIPIFLCTQDENGLF